MNEAPMGDNKGRLAACPDFVLKQAAEPLLHWYDGHARVLPWREKPAPYRVWLSEIMLQQTRVEAVKPYFQRFLSALPDVAALAAVPEEELLKLWEGLGYYNRARNLQKAARVVMEEYGGELPKDYDTLRRLPGIGPYTAGAIASIAYGKRCPAVDGNVLRVITRLLADPSDILEEKVKRRMERQLLAVMPEDRPGDFNQALMELGAVVCIPNGEPLCAGCPWETLCLAHARGLTGSIPYKAPKKARKVEELTVFIIKDGERTALHKRPARGLLAGLYEFPNTPGHLTEEEALSYVKRLGLYALHISELAPAKHIFTHKEWHMRAYAISIAEPADGAGEGLLFANAAQSEEKYPIPSAFAAYTEYLDIRLGMKDEEKQT